VLGTKKKGEADEVGSGQLSGVSRADRDQLCFVSVVCSRSFERERSDGGLWLRKGKTKKGKRVVRLTPEEGRVGWWC
jgi:hypothetical protein